MRTFALLRCVAYSLLLEIHTRQPQVEKDEARAQPLSPQQDQLPTQHAENFATSHLQLLGLSEETLSQCLILLIIGMDRQIG